MRSIFPLEFNPAKLAVPIREGAARVGFSEGFLRKEAAQGRLKIIKGGRRHIVAVNELKRWFDEMLQAAA